MYPVLTKPQHLAPALAMHPVIAGSPAHVPAHKRPTIHVIHKDPWVLLGPGGGHADVCATNYLNGYWRHGAFRRGEVDGAAAGVWLPKSMADGIQRAENYLNANYPGIHILVLDGHRGWKAQHKLYELYRAELIDLFPVLRRYPRLADIETAKYVSPPSTDPRNPSMHAAGAVDLILVQVDTKTEMLLRSNRFGCPYERQGNSISAIKRSLERQRHLLEHAVSLEFGTGFDSASIKASTHFYEAGHEGADLVDVQSQAARNNRIFLCFLMAVKAGLVPYLHEFWHFVSADSQAGAIALGHDVARLPGLIELDPVDLQSDEQVAAAFEEILGNEGLACFDSNLEQIARISPSPDLNIEALIAAHTL